MAHPPPPVTERLLHHCGAKATHNSANIGMVSNIGRAYVRVIESSIGAGNSVSGTEIVADSCGLSATVGSPLALSVVPDVNVKNCNRNVAHGAPSECLAASHANAGAHRPDAQREFVCATGAASHTGAGGASTCGGPVCDATGQVTSPAVAPCTVAAIADTAWEVGELSRFIGDADAEHLIANAVDAACDRLEIDPPLATLRHARALVTARHDSEWAAREQADADTLADAVEAGWLDREGNYIPERKYP